MSRVALVEYFIHSPGMNVDHNDKEGLLQKKKNHYFCLRKITFCPFSPFVALTHWELNCRANACERFKAISAHTRRAPFNSIVLPDHLTRGATSDSHSAAKRKGPDPGLD